MTIAIIGTGNVGNTLGRRWAKGGHTVLFGSRNPDRADLQALASEVGATVTTPAEAAQAADILLLATPWHGTQAALEALGDLSGKVLIDATNPIGSGWKLVGHPSGGEQVANWAPGAHVVKAFNTTGWENMADTNYGEGPQLTMFYAGDDVSANASVRVLIEALGFEAVYAGPLARSAWLEALAMLWIVQAFEFGYGRDFGFALARR